MTTYETKTLRDGLGRGIGPAQSGPFAGGLDSGLEYGVPHRIESVDGRKFDTWRRRAETKGTGEPTPAADAVIRQLLAEARARVGADEGQDADHDADQDDDPEEETMPDTPLSSPTAGVDERLVLEAPPETTSEKLRRAVVLAQVIAEAHLPAPGPPRELKVRFHVPYSRWRAETHEDEGFGEKAVTPFATGERWQGFYDATRPSEVWVDVARHPGEVIRNVLHELTHAWRLRTPEARSMTREQMEDECDDWADRLLTPLVAAAKEEGWRLTW